MSESEGLQKLTEYLKQTRRQAEIAIDNLNNQVIALRHENDELRAANENLKKEKLQADAAVQQLKVENTNKWKLRERDEWKALVESLQQERDQLQDECNNLHAKLMTAQSDLEFMKHDMSELSIRYGEVQLSLMEAQSDLAAYLQQQQQSLEHQQKIRRFSNAEDDEPPYSEQKDHQSIFTSPVLDRTGRTINFDNFSPTSIAQKLKQELREAHEQLKQDHVAQSEQLEKIRLLESRLKQSKQEDSNGHHHHFPKSSNHGNRSPNCDSLSASSPQHHHQRRNEGWLFNIWGFVFPSSPSLPKSPQRSLLTV